MNDLKEVCTKKHRNSISHAESCLEISEFWDTHDLSDFLDRAKEANFEVETKSKTIYYAVDKKRPKINRKINHGNSSKN